MQPHPILKAVIGDIARRDIERVSGNIHRIDPGIGKPSARQHRKTPRTGAEVEHGFHRRRVGDQRTPVLLVLAAKWESSNSPMKERGTMVRAST